MLGPIHIAFGAFIAYACVSLLWSPGPIVWATIHLFGLVWFFIMGHSNIQIPLRWLLNAGLVAIVAYLIWPVINPNYMGCILAIAFAAILAYQMWFYAPVYGLALAFTQSRGAIFAAGVTGLIAVWRKDRFIAMLILLFAILLMVTQKSLGVSLWSRMGIWQDTFNHLTPFGHGWGSFLAVYSTFPVRTNMTLELAPHAYNDFLELLFELGIGAIPLWIALILTYEKADAQSRLILLCFFLLTLTYFPLSVPIVCHAFAYTLGRTLGVDNGKMVTTSTALSHRSGHRLGT